MQPWCHFIVDVFSMTDLEHDNHIVLDAIDDAVIPDPHFSVSGQALSQRTACFDRIDQESCLESVFYPVLEVLRHTFDILGYERVVEQPINHRFFHSLL